MEEYSIHQFSKKLLQKSVFPQLKDYLMWQSGQKKLKDINFAPVCLNLDLTSACSNSCDHCIDKSVLNTGQQLDFNYLKNVISFWKKQGLKSVIVVGGGEPTLHPKFEEMIKFLKKLNLQVGIASNGSRLECIENICHLLEKKDWVRLSLDAATNKTYDQIHHPRLDVSLESILAQVKKMRKKNNKFQMGFSFLIIGDNKKVGKTKLVGNVKEIFLAAKAARDNGFSYFAPKPFISPEGTRKTTISPKNLKEIRNEINRAKKLDNKTFRVVESINLLCFYDKKLGQVMKKQPKTCHAQFFKTVANPGGVFLCSYWRGFENLKAVDVNKKAGAAYLEKLAKNSEKKMQEFNAKKFCKDVHCVYGAFNCWADKMIKSPEQIEKLEAIADFDDYFI